MPPMSTIVFETFRLSCRRWRLEDLGSLFNIYSDSEAMRWVGDGLPITKKQCEAWFEVTISNYAKRGYGMFALEERSSGNIIGFCGLVHPNDQELPEVKYAFRRSHWGNGYATESVRAMLDYGASQHAMKQIIATVAENNLASQRVLVKAGMKQSQRCTEEDSSVTFTFSWEPAGYNPIVGRSLILN